MNAAYAIRNSIDKRVNPFCGVDQVCGVGGAVPLARVIYC